MVRCAVTFIDSKYSEYGRPFVLNRLEDLFCKDISHITFGILPRNKPVLLITVQTSGDRSRAIVLSIDIIEDKIIRITEHRSVTTEMIFTS